jgi:phage terminase large subunit-like protein
MKERGSVDRRSSPRFSTTTPAHSSSRRTSSARAFACTRPFIAIDPAVSTGEDSDETGILVVALGCDLQVYVLADLSGKYTPNEWARVAIAAYDNYSANCLVAEVNQGGDLVVANLRTVDPLARVKAVHASRGKRTRAEPIAALYEQGRVHHVGVLAKLEDQMVAWDPSVPGMSSPDRMDALVWGVTELVLEAHPVRRNFDNLPPG